MYTYYGLCYAVYHSYNSSLLLCYLIPIVSHMYLYYWSTSLQYIDFRSLELHQDRYLYYNWRTLFGSRTPPIAIS